MRQVSTLLLCVICLSLGFWGGAVFDRSVSLPMGTTPSYADAANTKIDGTPLFQGSDWVARVVDQVMPSVVHIESRLRSPSSSRVIAEETGSGVIVRHNSDRTKYVVTNRHVVRNANLSDIQIRLQDGRQVKPTQKWSDEKTDIALLRLPMNDVVACEWGDSESIRMGNMVLAMGSPFGLSQSVSMGIVSAKSRRSLKLGGKNKLLNQDFIQTDAAINPGNSGGPLIDLHGRIVGINTAIASSTGGSEGVGFSTPSHIVKYVVDQLLAQGRVDRAYLGVMLDRKFTLEKARNLGLKRLRGALIDVVHPQTPASRANLKQGDVILSVDGIDVDDENHLINLISLLPIGTKTSMIIHRNGKRETIKVELADRQELEVRGR